MAIYAIGDLQGCYGPLMRLLERLRFDPARDQLWFAGDLVNRGKHSLETLRFIRSLGAAATSVLGNHDISLIAAFHGLRKPHKSLKKLVEAPDYPELIQWLTQRPLLHVDLNLGYAVCHAGIPPPWDLPTAQACAREAEHALQQPDVAQWLTHVYGDTPDYWDAQAPTLDRHRYILNALTRMRFCRMDGSLDLQEKGAPNGTKLIPWFQHPTRQVQNITILFGHWSTLGYYCGNKVIALDTGCVWGKQLSAIRIDTNNPKPISIECDDYG